MLACLYIGYALLRCKLNPNLGPPLSHPSQLEILLLPHCAEVVASIRISDRRDRI